MFIEEKPGKRTSRTIDPTLDDSYNIKGVYPSITIDATGCFYIEYT